MSYIGREPHFGSYKKLDNLTSQFNGNTTTFTLTSGGQAVYPGTSHNLIISLGGVIQEPGVAFTVNGNGPTITFSSAPVSTQTFFGVLLGDVLDVGTLSSGVNIDVGDVFVGQRFVLDNMNQTTPNGTYHNYPTGNNNAVEVMSTAGVTIITGLANGINGRVLHLLNNGAYAATLKHIDANSSAGNQMVLPHGADYVLQTYCAVQFWYWTPYWYMLGPVGLQQQSWITPTLLNGWAYYGTPFHTPGYYKDVFGVVHLKGMIASGTTNVLFTLPAGYRPPAQQLCASSTAPNSYCRIDIATDGSVYVASTYSNNWVSLDNIHFRTY